MARSKASTPNGGSAVGEGKPTTSANSKRSTPSGKKTTGLSPHAVANVLQNSLALVQTEFGTVAFSKSPQGLTVHLPSSLSLCAACRNVFFGTGDYCPSHVPKAPEVVINGPVPDKKLIAEAVRDLVRRGHLNRPPAISDAPDASAE